LASSNVVAWIFTVQEIGWGAAMSGTKSGKSALAMEEIAAAACEMHHRCGTRLWMGCTRLIFQQINLPVFY